MAQRYDSSARRKPLSDAEFTRKLYEEGSLTDQELARTQQTDIRKPLSDAAFERQMRAEEAGKNTRQPAPQPAPQANISNVMTDTEWMQDLQDKAGERYRQFREGRERSRMESAQAYYQRERPKEQKIGEMVWEGGQKAIFGQEKSGQRYYVLGQRPLNNELLEKFYGGKTFDNPLEHRQFISSDGKNRGFYPDGFREELDTHWYDYADANKYDADLIEESMREIEGEMEKKHGKNGGYSFPSNNCQHYTDAVLQRANEKAKQSGRQLILN